MKAKAEELFIINCLRAALTEKPDVEWEKTDLQNIDWDMVYEKATRWEVAPLLDFILKKRNLPLPFSTIPEHFLRKITIAGLRTFYTNQKNFKNLSEILTILKANSIKVILLKGCHLAQFVYQDISLRSMADIDILIQKKHRDKAEKLLLQIGYEYIKRYDDEQKQAEIIEFWKTDYCHLLPLRKSAGIEKLEIHWAIERLNSPFNKDIEGLWARAKPAKCCNVDVQVLAPEDLVLHLCVHACYHHKLRSAALKACCDLAAVINRYGQEMDWHTLVARARDWGGEKYVYLMLRLTKELLGTRMPDEILRALAPERCREKIIQQAQNRIFWTKPLSHLDRLTILEKSLFPHGSGALEKSLFVYRRIFISRNEMAERYGLSSSSWRIYLYYPYRLFTILWRYSLKYIPFLLYRTTHMKDGSATNYNLDLWLGSLDPHKKQ